jgi:hypothetical protein
MLLSGKERLALEPATELERMEGAVERIVD